ncbi:MAG TPA: AraC family transcriptional regulator [Clostridiales bacterium]|nr:AraC family transcriptional regulator [Clostridiales bacterium]
MDYEELEQRLLDRKEAEIFYRDLYYKNPGLYETTIPDWITFVNQYKKSYPLEIDIPLKPPGVIEEILYEKDFFKDCEIDVAALQHMRYSPGFLHQLEFIKIVYVLRGSYTFYLNSKKYDLKEGDFLVVPPGVEQAGFSCADGDITINILVRRSTFGDAFSSVLTEHDLISEYFWQMLYSRHSKKVLMCQCENDLTLDRIVLDICSETIEQKKMSNLLLKSYVMIFFGIMIREHWDNCCVIEHNSKEISKLPLLMKYIKENMKTVTLVALAEEFALSEGYLSRYIQNETGYSFSYLLRELRMKQAAKMLRNTNFSIEKIIEAVGYTDMSNFYRNFKTLYGMTPAKYRIFLKDHIKPILNTVTFPGTNNIIY